MNDECARQPEFGKLTVIRGGGIWRIFDENFTTDFLVITDL
jgi:hypothetical protein